MLAELLVRFKLILVLAIYARTSELTNAAPPETKVLRDHASSARLSDLRWPDFSEYGGRVQQFYEAGGYSLAWTRNGKVTDAASAIVEAIRAAAAKGLNAEDYDGSRWADRLVKLQSAYRVSTDDELARFDLALTVSVMRYISDLHLGRVNPGLFHDKFDLGVDTDDLAGFVRRRLVDAAGAKDVKAILDSVEPLFNEYWRTQYALVRYVAMAREPDRALLPIPKKPVEPGSGYPGVRQLADLLSQLGDMTVDVAVSPGSEVYDGALVDAVKHFQIRHGLDPDGRLGKATFVQLNTPLDRRILQLQLALERIRWVPHNFDHPPIVVNVPEFRLRALNNANVSELEMKVVVGKAYHHQTPVFAAEMKSVIFRPYWNVPRSIQRAELVPKIEKDRSYLADNGYEVVNKNYKFVLSGVVDDATLAALRSGALLIRQAPGARNSLGLIKFLFPNEHDVYLHDTPSTELFSKSRRDFSHGCIRVEKPAELAEWVLRDKGEWAPQRIGEAMRGEKTMEIKLDRPIPVLIVYATAVVLKTGEVRFFEDIYGQDSRLEALLKKGYDSPDWRSTNAARVLRPRE